MKYLPLLFLLTISLSVHCENNTRSLRKIVFSPQWTPQAQFAGYYMAQEKGFYADKGLNVEFRHANANISASSYLQDGKADFITLFLSSAIKHRAHGLKLVNIAQVSQHSGLIIVAKKRSGIKSIKDLNGKRLGLWRSDFQSLPKAFLQQNNLKMDIIPVSSGVNLFLRDGVDALSTMWYNEYHEIINKGLDENELTSFFLSNHKLNIPEDGIYCRQSLRASEPAVCQAFVDASVEGWRYAFRHPEETVRVVMKRMKAAHLATNIAHQNWMLNCMKSLLTSTGKVTLGLTEESYQTAADILEHENVIKTIPPFTQFYQPVLHNDKK